MTDNRLQLIEQVQEAIAQPPAAKPAGDVAQSLRSLAALAAQVLQEQPGDSSGEMAANVSEMTTAVQARNAKVTPAQFTSMVNPLHSALSRPDQEEVQVLVPEVAEVAAVAKVAAGEVAVSAVPACTSGPAKDSLAELTNELADDPEMVQEFLVESREHLAKVETGLLAIEKDPTQKEALHSVFRSFHTIKGLAGFMGAHTVQELAHETESVLDLVRSGNLTLGAELTDLILQSADSLTRMFDKVGELKLSDLPAADPSLLISLSRYSKQEMNASGATVVAAVEVASVVVAAKPLSLPVDVAEKVAVEVPQPQAPLTEAPQKEAEKKQTESGVVRVDTAKLEYLIDMVGELVIAESVVRNDPAVARTEDPALSRNLAQLSRVVEEVQKTSMAMRMVPVGTLFRKMTRLVRDLSRKCGKDIELVTFGEDVELDRTIVEELADPMVHMIRNAVDHGLESGADRKAVGKQEAGRVTLKALHDAGDIVIEISDDGKGLDKDRILAKARRVGLVEADQVPEDADIFRLIFEPGFSTASKVTDMSGRGVGMDVVKRHIQKLRGRIDIKSVPGVGCTFVLRLPLTLAIIDGLVVGVGSQRYILPMFGVREMFSPTEKTFVKIENRAEVALFRDKIFPVVRLSQLFKISDGSQNPGILVIAEARDQMFCIAVDQLIGKQEVVIKNLGKTFRDVPAVAGGAILGDGRVGLILDLNALR